jgi:hypothetical protein
MEPEQHNVEYSLLVVTHVSSSLEVWKNLPVNPSGRIVCCEIIYYHSNHIACYLFHGLLCSFGSVKIGHSTWKFA